MIEGKRTPEGNMYIPGIIYEICRRYGKKDDKKKVIEEWPFPDWPFDEALQIFFNINRRLSENNYTINESWDETTVELARIINIERAQARAKEIFNLNPQNNPARGATTNVVNANGR